MTSSKQVKKGILAKALEKAIKIFLKKECNRIGNIKVNIISSSFQIIKGIIKKISIQAENVNYKDLIFDEIELEANELNIIFKVINNELKFKNNSIINFKLSLSENSLKAILLSKNWNWIEGLITKKILKQAKFEDLSIKNNKIQIKTIQANNTFDEIEEINIEAESGEIHLKNITYKKSIKLPIEDKIYIRNINILNNCVVINAYSPISL